MLHNELKSIREALGHISRWKLSPEDADIIRISCRNLEAAADQAAQLEGCLVPPAPVNAPVAQGVM